MRITKSWLKKESACESGVTAWVEQGSPSEPIALIKLAMVEHLDWANWLIVRVMNKKQHIQYAIYSAELVIDNFEKQYPDDDRPRKAIEAAKAYLKNPCKKTRSAVYNAVYNAAYIADSAENAAYAAHSAVRSADSAAYSARSAHIAAFRSATYTARSAAYAAHSAHIAAYSAARSAAYSAAYAVRSAHIAHSAILKQIIEHGITLITKDYSIPPARLGDGLSGRINNET